jgi:squalene synthase HpnC
LSTLERSEADLRACEALARSHYENFAIGSRLLPRSKRRSLAALYAVVRVADDLADEGEAGAPAGSVSAAERDVRLAALDAWESGLESAAAGGDAPHFAQRAAGEAVRTLGLPLAPFRSLFRAFRRDLVQTRYESFEDLLCYCRDSADPVGDLVLRLFGQHEPRLAPASSAICTGLQLVNHWQDVASDARRGRIYLPLEDMTRFGVTQESLLAGEDSPALRSLLGFETARARALLEAGAELVAQVRGRLRLEVALFRRGGLAACDCLARAGWAVQAGPPRLGRRDRLRLLLGGLLDAAVQRRTLRAVEALRGA